MFRINLPNLEVLIEGCPEQGLAAVDFRREHGLPEATTNIIHLPIDVVDEALVRKHIRLADSGCDIVMDVADYNYRLSEANVWAYPNKHGYANRHVVSPAAIKQAINGHYESLLDELAANKGGREFLIQKKEEENAAVAELLALPDSKLFEETLYDDGSLKGHHRYRDLLGDFPRRTRFEQLQELVSRIAAEGKKRKAAMEAATNEAKHEKSNWILRNGSPRLRRMHVENITCERVYEDERLVCERPGWKYYDRVPGRTQEPRNVPTRAFEVLDEARKLEPDATLAYYTVDRDSDEFEGPDDDPKVYRGYVAVAKFLGKTILFGVPE